jgi:hypothetical protein
LQFESPRNNPSNQDINSENIDAAGNLLVESDATVAGHRISADLQRIRNRERVRVSARRRDISMEEAMTELRKSLTEFVVPDGHLLELCSEHFPEAAPLLFYEITGLWKFRSFPSNRDDQCPSDLDEEFEEERRTCTRASAMMRVFQIELESIVPIRACACCGVKNIERNEKFRKEPVTDNMIC